MHKPEATGPAQHTLDVVVVGEALTDIVTSHHGTTEHPGGSPANVAYGLGRLGVNTALLTAIGDDGRGAAIAKHLQSAGVTLLDGSCSLDRTSSATATISADGSASYAFDVIWDLDQSLPSPSPRYFTRVRSQPFLNPAPARSNHSFSNAVMNA